MSNEIQADYIPGGALDFYVKNAAKGIWYPVGQVFEAWGTEGRNATNYATKMTGDDGGNFDADFDTNISAGKYYITQKIRAAGAAGAAANNDEVFGNGPFYWSGTSELTESQSVAGLGTVAYVYNMIDSSTNLPMGDVYVWATTDEAGLHTVASGRTDNYGNVTFYLDAGMYFYWRKKAGINFDNPDVEVVS